MQPFVTVIIPIYNTLKYMNEAVDSVIKQPYLNKEIILIDDGSTDGAGKQCDELAESNPRIRVIHQENGGLSAARNTGLDYIDEKTEYIVFLDSDDMMTEAAIPQMVKVAQASDSDIVIPDRYYEFFDDTSERKIKFHFKQEDYCDGPMDYIANVIVERGRAWGITASLIRRRLIQEGNVRFIKNIVSEDFFFIIDILSNAKKFTIFPAATECYRMREGSISHSFNAEYESIIWMMDKKAQTALGTLDVDGKKRIALTKRNLVAYLTSVYSPDNSMDRSEKDKFAWRLLNNKRLNEYFRIKTALPYFNSNIAVLYFALQYTLIRFHMYRCSMFLAALCNQLKKPL